MEKYLVIGCRWQTEYINLEYTRLELQQSNIQVQGNVSSRSLKPIEYNKMFS